MSTIKIQHTQIKASLFIIECNAEEKMTISKFGCTFYDVNNVELNIFVYFNLFYYTLDTIISKYVKIN